MTIMLKTIWRYFFANSSLLKISSSLFCLCLFLIEILLSQIEAHFGSINDLAFSKPNNQLLVITCGEDMLVKVCLFTC